jgi:hypothetical protein
MVRILMYRKVAGAVKNELGKKRKGAKKNKRA